VKKKIVSILLCLVLVLSLVSCGNSKKKDAIEGTWKLSKAYFGENEVTQEQLQSAGIGGTTFTFKDGEVTIETASTEDTEVAEGQYSLSGSNVIISTKGEEGSYKGTLKDGELTIVGSNLDLADNSATDAPAATAKAGKKKSEKATAKPKATKQAEKDAPSTAGTDTNVEIKLVFEKQ
jgi:uncharacterized lipoprotein NlpE involved in copper resistance